MGLPANALQPGRTSAGPIPILSDTCYHNDAYAALGRSLLVHFGCARRRSILPMEPCRAYRDRAKECAGARENEKASKEERRCRALTLIAIYFRPGRFATPRLPIASSLGRFVPHGSGVPHEGVFTEQAVAYYEERAKTGIGMIILGGHLIDKDTPLHAGRLSGPLERGPGRRVGQSGEGS